MLVFRNREEEDFRVPMRATPKPAKIRKSHRGTFQLSRPWFVTSESPGLSLEKKGTYHKSRVSISGDPYLPEI